jgi:hypothetical protein
MDEWTIADLRAQIKSYVYYEAGNGIAAEDK